MTRSGDAPLLEVSGLTVTARDGSVLVDDLSLTVRVGERVALIGESGSGKSMTGLAIMGLLPEGISATGSVRIAGRDMLADPDRRLRTVRGDRLSVVFQEPLTALDPLATIGRQLGEVVQRAARRGDRRLSRTERHAAVRAALAEVSIAEPDRIARALPHQISGGQRQRVAIAMSLAGDPDLVILDEPTTALDVTIQAEVLALLHRLVDTRHMAVLFIGHDLAVVAQMAERALVLRRGETVETGEVATLIGDPHHPYTQELVAAARELDEALGARPVVA
ncbi:MAG: ABC transporter ATP-binding protein [Actinobacteria bacterium 69-20]|nr:ABC transporter ATP-binding protein [Actinomycetota bacterium]OJV23997.1 MAG: ABC transporter ATP-binding protein [Actinobacteria bacterium 69-20]